MELQIYEVANRYTDEDKYIHIDVYPTANDEEPGKTVAIVCLDTKKVFFLDNLYRNEEKVKESIAEVLEAEKNKFIGEVLKIADVWNGALSDGLRSFIENTIPPTYRDQVLKEHVYNLQDPEDFDQPVPENLEAEFEQLTKEVDRNDAGYIRIIYS